MSVSIKIEILRLLVLLATMLVFYLLGAYSAGNHPAFLRSATITPDPVTINDNNRL